jgi:hypothetical protein
MRRRRGLAVSIAAAAIGLAATATAAPAASIDALAPEGEVVEDSPWVLAARGRADRSSYFYAKIKPAGARPCAPTASTDDGTGITTMYVGAAGAWTSRGTAEGSDAPNPGDYLVCAWLEVDNAAVATKSITVHVRSSRATLALGVPSQPVVPGEPVTINVQGSSELQRYLYVRIKPAGGACGASPDADTGDSILYSHSVKGNFSVSKPTTPSKAGQYLLCGWVIENGSEPPEATAQATLTAQLPQVSFTPPGARNPIGTPRRRGRLASITVRGWLGRPAGVSRSEACKGQITITVNARRNGRYRHVTTRKAKVSSRTCRYRKTVRFRRSRVKGRKVRVVLEFPGNTAVARSTYRKTVTLRR